MSGIKTSQKLKKIVRYAGARLLGDKLLGDLKRFKTLPQTNPV